MAKLKISRRQLKHKEANDFSKLIKLTPNIIGYSPKELLRLNSLFVMEENSTAMGLIAYVEDVKFIDLKIFIVKEEFRGDGFGSKLFNKFMYEFDQTPKPIYTVTRNEIVIRMLKKSGFVKANIRQLPLSCIMHQSKMILSFYRTKEYIRKLIRYHGENKFSYYIRWPDTK